MTLDVSKTQQLIAEAIRTCYDPEIPVNIYDLGLIYEIIVEADGKALVKMTLTSPFCPAAQTLPAEVRSKTKAIPGVTEAKVDVIWDPPWNRDMMSDAAKMALGMY